MADTQVDNKYDPMRRNHGASRAEANGYLFDSFFQRERRFLTNRVTQGLTLDIACGSGLMLQGCPELNVVGVDYNHMACVQAKDNQVTVTRCDAFNLPFAENSFESIVNCQFLNQQNEAARLQLLTEIQRILAPNGHCHLLWRGADTLIHKTANQLDTWLRKLRAQEVFPQFEHSPEAMCADARTVGLSVQALDMTLPLGPIPTVQPGSLVAKLFGASYYLRLTKP